MTWRATCFDGQSSTPHAVRVSLQGQLLRIDPANERASLAPAEIPLAQLTAGERFRAAPRMIELPGGRSLQVDDDDSGGFDRALRDAGHHPGLVYRLIERWRSVVICLLLLIGVTVWVDRQGVGLVANFAVPLVPDSVDAALGRSVLSLVQTRWLTASVLPAQRQEAIGARFTQLVHAQYPSLQCQLLFRGTRGTLDNYNAFALPGCTIVVLDGLAAALTDEEILAVLGHELGHVVHRDAMHGIAQQMGLLSVASIVWGDISTFAASTAAGFQELRFSRVMEANADAFAVSFLRRGGIPVKALAGVFEAIEREEARRGKPPAFLDGHPPTAERLRAAQAAAASEVPASP